MQGEFCCRKALFSLFYGCFLGGDGMEEKRLEECFVIRGDKKLRFGYTTGSCAAAAAKGAVRMLLFGERSEDITLMTPAGILLCLKLLDMQTGDGEASCAVRKDAGDDPDTTDGILVYAKAAFSEEKGIHLVGGTGVGRVTKPGLSCQVGEAAINPVPRQMILGEVAALMKERGYEGGLTVTVSVPEGEQRAKKTFNPRLGIEGGISILGTTGIVEPMSEKALVDSIRVELRQHLLSGEEYLLVTPGNYGETYLKEQTRLPFEKNIKCSNYVGETIDMAIGLGAKGLLFVSHIGKFVKVAGGIMNTHSHSADSRMEILAAAAVRAGAQLAEVRRILSCSTTDEALDVLAEAGCLEAAMKLLLEKIQFYLDHRSYEQITLGAVIFSNVHGYLGMTKDAEFLIKKIREEK